MDEARNIQIPTLQSASDADQRVFGRSFPSAVTAVEPMNRCHSTPFQAPYHTASYSCRDVGEMATWPMTTGEMNDQE